VGDEMGEWKERERVSEESGVSGAEWRVSGECESGVESVESGVESVRVEWRV
jgi:3-oxoacyl-(acyl-carrier-protein) synthase